jgi:hypothetical protein
LCASGPDNSSSRLTGAAEGLSGDPGCGPAASIRLSGPVYLFSLSPANGMLRSNRSWVICSDTSPMKKISAENTINIWDVGP